MEMKGKIRLLIKCFSGSFITSRNLSQVSISSGVSSDAEVERRSAVTNGGVGQGSDTLDHGSSGSREGIAANPGHLVGIGSGTAGGSGS